MDLGFGHALTVDGAPADQVPTAGTVSAELSWLPCKESLLQGPLRKPHQVTEGAWDFAKGRIIVQEFFSLQRSQETLAACPQGTLTK